MGAGASAAEGRIFCHGCGARSAAVGAAALRCRHCGATDGVEFTDARLPVMSSSTGWSRSSPVVPGTPNAATLVAAASGAAPLTPPAAGGASRVESVTVVAIQQPEDGGLLLRVLPNVVSRSPREASSASSSLRAGEGGSGGGDGFSAEAEDWEVPPEPACQAYVSRLEAQPLMALTGSEGDTVCAICAEDMRDTDALVVSLHCGHSFHDSCIRQWLTQRHTCPTCRFEFEVDDVRYLRSIGLMDEAEVLEKAQKEKQAVENAKQAAERRRWVESMRRGDPVHFGLSCGRCKITPLTGECYRCCTCEGFMLCADCYGERDARLRCGGASGSGSRRGAGGSGSGSGSSGGGGGGRGDGELALEEHPESHSFALFGSGSALGVPLGPGGLLTVLVPAPARSGQTDSAASPESEAAQPGGAAAAAAEVAFAAVRSLALAPLAATDGASPAAAGSVAAGSSRSLSPRRLRLSARRVQ